MCLYICEYVYLWMLVCMHEEARGGYRVLLNHSTPYPLSQGFYLTLEYFVFQLEWLAGKTPQSSSFTLALGLQVYTATPGFYMGAGN